MAAPVIAVVVKKAAAVLLTDKRTWTAIGSIIAGIFIFILLTVTIVFGGLFAHQSAENIEKEKAEMMIRSVFSDDDSAEDMPTEYRDEMFKVKEVFRNVEESMGEIAPEVDPVKAQVILICVLMEKSDDENFHDDYAKCFAETEEDNEIFDRISEKFQIEISVENRVNILSLYQNAVENIPQK